MDYVVGLFKKEPVGCIAIIVSVMTIFSAWFISVNEINKAYENAKKLQDREEVMDISYSAAILSNEFRRVYGKSSMNIELADTIIEKIEIEDYSLLAAKNLNGKYTILSEDQFVEHLSKVSRTTGPVPFGERTNSFGGYWPYISGVSEIAWKSFFTKRTCPQ